MTNKPVFRMLSKLATTIIVGYGIITLPFEVYERTKSTILSVIFAVMLAIIFGCIAVYYILPSAIQRRFGIEKHSGKFVVTETVVKINIDREFIAFIEAHKTFVFLSEPSKNDLVDLIDLLPENNINHTHYFSKNSRKIDVKKKDEDRLAIYWEPDERIVPHIPHTHNFGYRCPDPHGDDAFYHASHIDADTGKSEKVFESELPIEYAFAFRLPFYRSRITLDLLYNYTFQNKIRNCSQPNLESPHRITWTLLNPKKNRTYVIFAFYENGKSDFRDDMEKRHSESSFTDKVRALASRYI